MSEPKQRVRLDRWLWAARFFKTRARAKAAIEGGKVQVTAPDATAPGSRAAHKPKVSKEVAPGDMLEIRRGWSVEVVEVTGVSEQRGSATEAATLYRETPESVEAREAERARRRMERAGLQVPPKRPSKRNRRELQKLKSAGGPSAFDDTEDS
ncbi:MAG: RNA-binding S4 domain-containing protein [Pseudomonadota bacterium]